MVPALANCCACAAHTCPSAQPHKAVQGLQEKQHRNANTSQMLPCPHSLLCHWPLAGEHTWVAARNRSRTSLGETSYLLGVGSCWQTRHEPVGAFSRRSRHRQFFFLAVLLAPFWTQRAEVGGIKPGALLTSSYMDFNLNEADTYGHFGWLRKADLFLPTMPTRVGASRASDWKKDGVHDTIPVDGVYAWESVGEFQLDVDGNRHYDIVESFSAQACLTQEVNVVSRTLLSQLVVPGCSLFYFMILLQFYLSWLLSYRTKGRCFTHRRSFLIILCGVAVLPVCAFQSDRNLRTRLMGVSVNRKSLTWRYIHNVRMDPWGSIWGSCQQNSCLGSF